MSVQQPVDPGQLQEIWGRTNTTEADMVEPSDGEKAVGWPLSATPPSRQRFNWILNWLFNAVMWLCRVGVPPWRDDKVYMAGDMVHVNGYVYRCRFDDTLYDPLANGGDGDGPTYFDPTSLPNPSSSVLWEHITPQYWFYLSKLKQAGPVMSGFISGITVTGSDASNIKVVDELGTPHSAVGVPANGDMLRHKITTGITVTKPYLGWLHYDASGDYSTAKRPVVKGNGRKLNVGDLPLNHIAVFQFNSSITLSGEPNSGSWVLLNPATGNLSEPAEVWTGSSTSVSTADQTVFPQGTYCAQYGAGSLMNFQIFDTVSGVYEYTAICNIGVSGAGVINHDILRHDGSARTLQVQSYNTTVATGSVSLGSSLNITKIWRVG